jgi:hypothetical protein
MGKELCVTPAGGSGITVDGITDDWDLTEDSPDFFHNMYRAGKNTKELQTKAYMRYDCASTTLCILVMNEAADYLIDDGEYWFKIYDIQNSVYTPMNGGIKSVTDSGKDIGWEGCFNVPQQDYVDAGIEIHANVQMDGESQTSSTGKGTGYDMGMKLQCC